jgi:hypothetical protein
MEKKMGTWFFFGVGLLEGGDSIVWILVYSVSTALF